MEACFLPKPVEFDGFKIRIMQSGTVRYIRTFFSASVAKPRPCQLNSFYIPVGMEAIQLCLRAFRHLCKGMKNIDIIAKAHSHAKSSNQAAEKPVWVK